jgi:CheY-like chemotaxis protein/HPt (histidine-containing phosphotransfer) domain-containing protein
MVIPIRQQTEQQSARILIAEDNPDNQSLISFYVRQNGAEAIIAQNGLEAIEKALAENFDLVLMDIQMPVMDGLQATGILRSRGYKQPIVALTANAFNEDRERCLCIGCDDFLPKPIDRTSFENMLNKYLPDMESSANTAPSTAQQSSDYEQDAATIASDEPIFSILVQNEPELSYIVSSYIERLSSYESRIDAALQKQDWQELRQIFHDLRGTGTSMGYPMLTDIATEAGGYARQENTSKLEHAINKLHEYCSRIRSGFNKTNSTRAS